jgi:hypothetical protein
VSADMLPFEALIGNRDFPEVLLGFEPISRAARLVLLEGLNAEIDAQAERWAQADLALQSLGLDPGVGQVEVEHIAPGNIFEGSHKSLLTSPKERFPNVSVAAYMVVPSAEQFDQIDQLDLTLFAESMVIAGPVTDDQEVAFETIVHRRAQRMTEAVAAVLRRSGNLLGTVNPIQMPPRGGVGNASWLRKEKSGAGPRYLIQGSRLQYTLQRHAALA